MHQVPINGDVLRDLRVLRLLSQEALAHAAGCTREEISAYERGTRQPRVAQLDRIVTALKRYPVTAQQWLLIRTPALDRVMIQIEGAMNRRELIRILTAGISAGVGAGAVILPAPRRAGAPPPRLLHEQTIALAARYPGTAPIELLPDARHHLNVLTEALRRPLAGERTMLLVDAAETASLAARTARLAGYHGEAGAYFGLAESLAGESGYDTMIGLTRIATAAVHGPLVAGGDGDWITALGMVNSALPLVGASGPGARWAHATLAEVYADLGRGPEAEAALERYQAADGDGGASEGFFSTRGRFYLLAAPGHFDVIAGRCCGLLGRTEEALGHLARHGHHYPEAEQTDIMLAHACAGEPEPMCEAAHLGLDLTLATPQGAGDLSMAEIRGARRKLPEPCAGTACVAVLDERLAAL